MTTQQPNDLADQQPIAGGGAPHSRPAVLFVSGLQRSGTTVMTTAVTEATGGITTTVQVLARHIPSLQNSLPGLIEDGADRGVDRLKVTPGMTDEYGFLLYRKTGRFTLYGKPEGVSVLRAHIDELAAEAPGATVVLKSPWDAGQEARMLADFPEARILLIGRNVADIERSARGSVLRNATERPYLRAVRGNGPTLTRILEFLLGPRWRMAILIKAINELQRYRAAQLMRRSAQLPLDRVAFLSYDEMRADPYQAAAWAAHILSPQALAESFLRHAFPEQSSSAPANRRVRRLNREWEQAWQTARVAQVAAGILPCPASDD